MLLHLIKEKRLQITLILLLVVIVGGLFLRAWDLGAPSLWIDEGFSLNAADSVVAYGYPLLDSGKVYTSSLLHTYTTASIIKVFSFNAYSPWVPRIPSVIFGTGTILLMYILMYVLTRSKLISLVSATVIAFSYWEIEWSRQIRGYAQMQFFFIATLIFFFQWLQTRNIKYFFTTTLSAIAAFMSHFIAIVLIPVIAISLLTYYILHRHLPLNKKAGLTYAILAVAGLAVVLPKFLGSQFYNFIPFYSSYFSDHLSVVTGASIAGVLLGIFDKKRFWPIMFLSISLLFSILVIIGYAPLVQMRYLFPFFPLAVGLSVYGIWRILELFQIPLSLCHARKVFLFVIIVFIMFNNYLVFTPQEKYHLEPDSPRPNFVQAYNLIQSSIKDNDIIISPYAHLSKIYLEDRGYWLPISLTGKKSDLEKTIINGEIDYYVGAPIIKDIEHLAKLLGSRHGFIVIDGMARIRTPESVALIENLANVENVYASGEKKLDKIWVYKF